MTLGELRIIFVGIKQYEPADMNELLDFAGQRYLRGEMGLAQYRNVVRELEAIGAKKPDYMLEGIIQRNS
ncbi:YppF family protein [Ectobacillus panaciterrae]|uniref:YppF family protein n=1 Tax=Ectobacillus panaciterrae TaxID=363872 RepID=UPI0004002545|nr:YppF family protein [Ectobacillus panaciterrae]